MPTTVICVPGPWEDESQLRQALVAQQVLYAGLLMRDMKSGFAVEAELADRDPRMRRSFVAAGGYSTLTASEYDAVDAHRTVCYLVHDAGGSMEAARSCGAVALSVVRAGGHGVKVESAGRAHSPGEWQRLFGGIPTTLELVDAYVTWVGDAGHGYYSCGMHNLGLCDVSAPASLSPGDAGHLLKTFCIYEAGEEPELREGQTFATALGEPVYRLVHTTSQFPPDDLFHNPFGVWDLRSLSGT